MGNNTSQKITENQQILTTATQISASSCNIDCTQDISDVTIIKIGGTGDINIYQTCTLSGVSCVMQTSMDTQIDTILSAIADQSSSQSSQPFWDIPSNCKQSVDITQLIENTITQVQVSSCEISAVQTQKNIYVYAQDVDGDITLSQEVLISNSTCNMTNNDSIVSNSTATSDTSNDSVQKKGLGMFMMLLIIMVIMGGIIMCVFLLTGGTAMVMKSSSQKSSGGEKGGGMDPSSIMKIAGDNPEMVNSGLELAAENPELLALAV
jgi:hypothetical protein